MDVNLCPTRGHGPGDASQAAGYGEAETGGSAKDGPVEVPKRLVVEHFLRRDDVDRAVRADETLGDPVDLTRDAEVLRGLGLDPGLLATQIDNLEA